MFSAGVDVHLCGKSLGGSYRGVKAEASGLQCDEVEKQPGGQAGRGQQILSEKSILKDRR